MGLSLKRLQEPRRSKLQRVRSIEGSSRRHMCRSRHQLNGRHQLKLFPNQQALRQIRIRRCPIHLPMARPKPIPSSLRNPSCPSGMPLQPLLHQATGLAPPSPQNPPLIHQIRTCPPWIQLLLPLSYPSKGRSPQVRHLQLTLETLWCHGMKFP